ncbi:hypothetical protein HDU96_000476 [Phlyctochytrium bullatum]|nr:hypothetical protein HDU96_000476 [Phlyctochytrium bullatum]
MAATIQTHHAPFPRHRRLPSDPLNESIYNLVTKPEDDRPPPLYRSRFAQQVRAEHLANKRGGNAQKGGQGGSSGSFDAGPLPLSSSSWSPGMVSPPNHGSNGGSRPGTVHEGLAGGGLAGGAMKLLPKKAPAKQAAPAQKAVPKTSTGLYFTAQGARSSAIPIRSDKIKAEKASTKSKASPQSKYSSSTLLF